MRLSVKLMSLAAILATSMMAKEINVGVILPMSGALAGYGQVAY
ncbi:MAG: branched-chain amino acid ABC transporter substrate-binding protein, partial [Epsilonproteobacteria bacterium]|nr:branched-chain amino acid ABC transporter substrate-binding protein [Campylobacterota bacterium]